MSGKLQHFSSAEGHLELFSISDWPLPVREVFMVFPVTKAKAGQSHLAE